MTNDEIVIQMQQLVETFGRVVAASGDLAERVESIEQRTGEQLGILTAIQSHLQDILEQFRAQHKDYKELLERVDALEARNNFGQGWRM